MSQLRKTYAELLSLSNKRVSDLHSLLDFLQAATQELIWLNEKEEQELNRDWANKSLNITDVERYYEVSTAVCSRPRSLFRVGVVSCFVLQYLALLV